MSNDIPSGSELDQIQKFRELLVGQEVKKSEVQMEQLKKELVQRVDDLDAKISSTQEKIAADLKALESKMSAELESLKNLAATVDKLKSNKVSRVQFGKAFKELGEKFLEVPNSK